MTARTEDFPFTVYSLTNLPTGFGYRELGYCNIALTHMQRYDLHLESYKE